MRYHGDMTHTVNAETRARELGTLHGETGHAPYGCLSDAGSARLMDALGQTGPTTHATHDFRLFLLDTYVEAWEQETDANYPFG